MIFRRLMDNPILAIGILLFTIFIYDLKNKGIIFSRKKVQADSCYSASVMLNKRIPDTWEIECENNNLTVIIEDNQELTPQNVRQVLYRSLANHLVFISKNSLNESLERVFIVRVSLNHSLLRIEAITEGQHISKFAFLKSQQFISEHLQQTVQVKEIPK